MKPSAFAYAKARSVEHAVELLESSGGDGVLLAGGQSLVVTLNMRLQAPALVIDINRIAGLDRIVRAGDRIEIGAMARQSEAERSPEVCALAPLLAKALPHVAHPAIRNRGTIGGSIALADPAAELPACLLALGGAVRLQGPHGVRTVAADAFFGELYETDRAPDEMLVAVEAPVAGGRSRFAFAEIARRHGDYALAGLAAAAVASDGGLEDVRLAFFGLGLKPVRARGAEAALAGGSLEDAVAALETDLDPLDNLHASAPARRQFARTLLRRAAAELRKNAP
jgi:carbon-monoxide dehydrogenase medium subunit